MSDTLTETFTGSDLLHPTNARALAWNGDGEAPRGGDTVNLGFTGLNAPQRWDTSPVTHVEIPFTAWGDYHGSTVERANFEALLEDFPETFVTVLGGYGGHSLALPLDAEISEDLHDLIRGLNDYPLYDEEAHGTLEMRLQDEAWESDGAADFRRELELWAHPEEGEAFVPAEIDLHELFRDACEAANFYPHCEDAVSAYLFSDLVVSEAGWLLLKQWEERTIDSNQLALSL